MNSIKLIFKTANSDQGDYISGLLSSLEIEGSEQIEGELYIYIQESNYNESDVKTLLQGHPFDFSTEILPMQNWNAVWESNFEPIRIHQTVGVRAHFHPPFTDCQYDILITPKMSFGTGHHETTQMMLTYLCDTDCSNKSVFDFGCGTGVLAIFAKLKGSAETIGIDNDAWSVENAIENCIQNKCRDIQISDDTLQEFNKPFDIILANINLNVLLETLPKLHEMLKSDGVLYLSGILISDINTISERFINLGFELISKKQLQTWSALHIKKRNV
jgi:ribosomal protein L11 methyltransferase